MQPQRGLRAATSGSQYNNSMGGDHNLGTYNPPPMTSHSQISGGRSVGKSGTDSLNESKISFGVDFNSAVKFSGRDQTAIPADDDTD